MCKLSVQIETQDERDLYKLFLHVFREITEMDYRDDRIESKSKTENGWLDISKIGRYKWSKHIDKQHNLS